MRWKSEKKKEREAGKEESLLNISGDRDFFAEGQLEEIFGYLKQS